MTAAAASYPADINYNKTKNALVGILKRIRLPIDCDFYDISGLSNDSDKPLVRPEVPEPVRSDACRHGEVESQNETEIVVVIHSPSRSPAYSG